MQTDDADPKMRRIGATLVVVLFAFLAYNVWNRGRQEALNVLDQVAVSGDPVVARAPYSELRSDAADPELSNTDRAERAATARFQATGGKTTNASGTTTDMGKLSSSIDEAAPFAGLTTRSDIATVAQQRLAVLDERAREANAPVDSIYARRIAQARARASEAVTPVVAQNAPDAEWVAQTQQASLALTSYAQEIRSAVEAH